MFFNFCSKFENDLKEYKYKNIPSGSLCVVTVRRPKVWFADQDNSAARRWASKRRTARADWAQRATSA